MSRIRLILGVMVLFATVGWFAPTGAQGAGDALCADALAAARGGASRFQGKAIVFGSGGSGAQVVLGTGGDDVLDGGSGNDLLCGFGGDDVLTGGSGNDVLVGGAGVDELSGETGGDTLYGSFGEILDGGTGSNTLVVGPAPQVNLIVGPLVREACDVTFVVSGGVPNALYRLVALALNPGDEEPISLPSGRTTDANGNLSSEVFTSEEGVTFLSAEVVLDATGTVIAAFDINETCGA